MKEDMWDNQELVQVLKSGGVAVMPTDTIYGIVGQARNKATVERIYKIRKRAPDKPCIILISDESELGNFSITLSGVEREKLATYWGNGDRPTSVVLDCPDEALSYLHRGTYTLAFRKPHVEQLRALLAKTGPLVAPSANIEKFPPSNTVDDAKNYFGDAVDLYIDGGPIRGQASTVMKLHPNGSLSIIRK